MVEMVENDANMSSSSSGVQADKKPGTPIPGGKLLRLRSRMKPLLHEAAIEGIELESGPDVWFVCSEGKVVGGHKIILSISSKFFSTVMHDQNTTDQTVIHVSEVPVETMQVILSLLYRDNVVVSSNVMADIGDYMCMFGMGLDKFIVGEARENAQPVLNRVYDHIPNRDKTSKDDKLQEGFSRKKGVVPASTIANSTNTTSTTPGTSNIKKLSNGLQAIVPVATPPALAPAQPLQLVSHDGKFYTIQPSQDPKMPSQLHLLDPQPIINTVSVPVQAESPVLGNNLAVGQDQKRQRLILPKPTSTGGDNGISAGQAMKAPNLRPITASELMNSKAEETVQREIDDGPPVLERMTYTDKENAMEIDADEDHVPDSNDPDVQTEQAAQRESAGVANPQTSTPVQKYPDPGRPGKFLRKCEECYKWTQYHNWIYHIKTDHKTEQNFCEICFGVVFETKAQLLEHQVGCHAGATLTTLHRCC